MKRPTSEKALRATTTHRHDYLNAYIGDLGNVIDMDAVRAAKISLGVDPLGGAGVHYWAPIAERYGLDLTGVNEAVDPFLRFMTVDWDGQIRMDPSSPYAMQQEILTILTHAPGNGAPIGGLKVVAESGWFVARPSGSEGIYRIHAESLRGIGHLHRILEEAQTIVSDAPAAPRA